ncbi:NmrA-like protein [Neofusicoccum parvum]|nr:NmrA-like protein [Neofusicoccum parvum]
MVNVVIAGGSGNVAREVIDRIVAKNKHNVTVFTRQTVENPRSDGLTWVQVDYKNKHDLADKLHGVDVVLSFFSGADRLGVIQTEKNLIDAAVQAGVKRFAPAEWGTRSNNTVPFYTFKDDVRKYLEDLNKDKTVIEYSLFQPGLFLNYLGYPHSSTKHFSMSPIYVDLEKRRAIIVSDGNSPITFTTIQDMAGVVAEALDYEGKWPATGGMQGTQTTVAELVELGTKLRGSMDVESVSLEDLEAGELKSSWYPPLNHPSIPAEMVDEMSKTATIHFLCSAAKGEWSVSDDWNKLLPSFRFTTAEEYLRTIWDGKP